MSIPIVRNQPLKLHGNAKNDVRTQFGALCWRIRKKKVEIALITSRRTARWIIPKGWPVEGATPTEAASLEAWEEAGIEGKVGQTCLGIFSYAKAVDDGMQPCVVAVFPLEAERVHSDWPESSQRRRKWMSRKKAAKVVSSVELAQIIRAFDPRALMR